MKKQSVDEILGMFATIQSRIFCSPSAIWDLYTTNFTSYFAGYKNYTSFVLRKERIAYWKRLKTKSWECLSVTKRCNDRLEKTT